jgi:hypothetical protein
MRRWLFVGTLFAAQMMVLTPARAGILSVSGDVEQIAAPSSVVSGAIESSTLVRVFLERQNFTLADALEVDFTAPGHYDQIPELPVPSPTIAAGTRVDSYFFHADPAGGSGQTYDGSVTFTTDILGVILFNPDNNPKLRETDLLLGHPATTYPPAGNDTRDIEFDGSDEITLSADRRTLTFHLVTLPSPMDQLRVITAESVDAPVGVPEPASLSLAILSLFLGAGVGWRRRHRAARR